MILVAVVFVVERWFLWSSGELRKQEHRHSTKEAAEREFLALIDYPATTRLRLSKKTAGTRGHDVLRVWQKAMA